VNFFDANRLCSKDGAEINFFVSQTNAAIVGGNNGLVVEGIIITGRPGVVRWVNLTEDFRVRATPEEMQATR
jgi:hypothetical protein